MELRSAALLLGVPDNNGRGFDPEVTYNRMALRN
jgi:hypothetical protein